MVDIKSIHRSYLIIIKVLLIVNIELTQYLRLHKFDQYCIDPRRGYLSSTYLRVEPWHDPT